MDVDWVFARHGCLCDLVRNLPIDGGSSVYEKLTHLLSGNATRDVIIES